MSQTATNRLLLETVTRDSIPDLMELHSRTLPVSYNATFYKEVLQCGELAKLLYYDGKYAGAICCRIEPLGNVTGIYMMTLCVSKLYRNMGLGTLLIKSIMNIARQVTNPLISMLYLHVQTTNEAAIRFYTKNGFRIHQFVRDYYRLDKDRDAYILVRPVSHQDYI